MLRPFLTNLISLSPPELRDLGGLVKVVFCEKHPYWWIVPSGKMVPVKIVAVNLTIRRLPAIILAPRKSASLRSAPLKSAPIKFTSRRSAFLRFAPRRFALNKLAPNKLAASRLTLCKKLSLRSA